MIRFIGYRCILGRHLFCYAAFESLQIDEKIKNSTKMLEYSYTLRKSMSHDEFLLKTLFFEALNFYLKMAYIYMTKPVQEEKIWIINLTL